MFMAVVVPDRDTPLWSRGPAPATDVIVSLD